MSQVYPFVLVDAEKSVDQLVFRTDMSSGQVSTDLTSVGVYHIQETLDLNWRYLFPLSWYLATQIVKNTPSQSYKRIGVFQTIPDEFFLVLSSDVHLVYLESWKNYTSKYDRAVILDQRSCKNWFYENKNEQFLAPMPVSMARAVNLSSRCAQQREENSNKLKKLNNTTRPGKWSTGFWY